MTKPVITKRATKGSALTYDELDANFQNLDDATISLKAGSSGTTVTSDLNGTITLVAGSNVTLSGNNTTKEVTITATGDSLNPLSDNIVTGNKSIYSGSAADPLTLAAGSLSDTKITLMMDASGTTGLVEFWSEHPATDFQIGQQQPGSVGRVQIRSPLQITPTTTTQRNANSLLAVNTSIIYNSTTNKLQVGNNTSGWGNVLSYLDSTVPIVNVSENPTSYANGATVDFPSFSGMILINRQDAGSGNVALWIAGSGAAVKLGDSIGNQSGTIASNSGIDGYRWTNNTGGTITATFFAIKTRASA